MKNSREHQQTLAHELVVDSRDVEKERREIDEAGYESECEDEKSYDGKSSIFVHKKVRDVDWRWMFVMFVVGAAICSVTSFIGRTVGIDLNIWAGLAGMLVLLVGLYQSFCIWK